ncbi:hypothetical protein GCM10010521_06600 [Streptomyces rameus]|uniref:N-acetyltransferase domain-containing protein n=1 Tax=Streptomyces rameus TaxID=68261 RepID=A0ABP6MRL4_9ACTN
MPSDRTGPAGRFSLRVTRNAPGKRPPAPASGARTHRAPPTGRLLVGRYDGTPAGSAGVRLSAPDTDEPTRVFVLPGMRGLGGAARLVAAAERAARSPGARRIVLDTRGDLVEARALYARLGSTETGPHNSDPYEPGGTVSPAG